jgi:hypothetical protein
MNNKYLNWSKAMRINHLMGNKFELELELKVLWVKCQVKLLNHLMKMIKANLKAIFLLFSNKNKNYFSNYKSVKQSKE